MKREVSPVKDDGHGVANAAGSRPRGRPPTEHRHAIIDCYRAGITQREIAARFNVTQACVNLTIKRMVSADERLTVRRGQLCAAGAARSASNQAKKIAGGVASITIQDGVLRFVVGGVETLFDADVEDLVRAYSWRLSSANRLARQERGPDGRRVNIYAYHDVMGVRPSRSLVVDHINRNPTDNRRANLRLCSQSENARNRGPKNTHEQLDSREGG